MFPALVASPLARLALRFGVVAAIALLAARHRQSQPKDALHAQVLDDLPEGAHLATHRAQAESAVHGHGRLRRVIRIPTGTAGLEIDAAALGRLRFRRVD